MQDATQRRPPLRGPDEQPGTSARRHQRVAAGVPQAKATVSPARPPPRPTGQGHGARGSMGEALGEPWSTIRPDRRNRRGGFAPGLCSAAAASRRVGTDYGSLPRLAPGFTEAGSRSCPVPGSPRRTALTRGPRRLRRSGLPLHCLAKFAVWARHGVLALREPAREPNRSPCGVGFLDHRLNRYPAEPRRRRDARASRRHRSAQALALGLRCLGDGFRRRPRGPWRGPTIRWFFSRISW